MFPFETDPDSFLNEHFGHFFIVTNEQMRLFKNVLCKCYFENIQTQNIFGQPALILRQPASFGT